MQKEFVDLQKERINNLIESLNFEPRCIVLFGSLAKGNYSESSDIDLLIVAESNLNWFDRHRGIENGMDVFIYTPDEIEKMLSMDNGFILDTLEDGTALYDDGYWKRMKKKFSDRKKSGIIKKIKNGWKICVD